MPLPGLNPVDTAPPAGTTKEVATASMIARLWGRLTDTERRMSDVERPRAPEEWKPVPLAAGFQTYGGGSIYQPVYRMESDFCVRLKGLVQNPTAGIANDTWTNIALMPTGYRPSTSPTNDQCLKVVAVYTGSSYLSIHLYIEAATGVVWVRGQGIAIQTSGYVDLSGYGTYTTT